MKQYKEKEKEKEKEEADFFNCIARAFQMKYSAKYIHNQTLIHFARILFTQASECMTISEILNQQSNAEWIVSKSACLHPAIKSWIGQVHATERVLHKDPIDWYNIYPKMFKGLAFRFIYYHRNYKLKPYRLFSARVFGHLVAELYNCRLCLDRKHWIYPIDSEDYIIEMNTVTIHLETASEGKFIFHPEEQKESLIVVKPKMALPFFPEREDKYMLRKYSVENLQVGANGKGKRHKNTLVGMLTPPPYGKRVHQIEYQPLAAVAEAGEEEDLYQIYPGNAAKTFYEPFAIGYGLYVYLALKKPGAREQLKITFAAKTESHDQYVYFPVTPNVLAVLVVYASSQQEAETVILNETSYSL